MESCALENPRKFLFLFFVLNSKSFHSTTADRGGEFLAPSSSLSRYSTHSHTHTHSVVYTIRLGLQGRLQWHSASVVHAVQCVVVVRCQRDRLLFQTEYIFKIDIIL